MYIANNELIKTDKRIKISKIASTNTNVIAVMEHIIITAKLTMDTDQMPPPKKNTATSPGRIWGHHQIMVPWCHLGPHPKRHLDQLSCCSGAHGSDRHAIYSVYCAVSKLLNDSHPHRPQKKDKGGRYLITEHRVLELILVLGSQPAGYVSHKPSGRLPRLSTTTAVTLATLKRAATNFAAW